MNILNKVLEKRKYYVSLKKKHKLDKVDGNIVNWAIIGTGNMANTFAQALKIAPGARIIAVSSRTQEKAELFAKNYGIPYSYNDYEKMLKDSSIKIDVVYIATPLQCHYEDIKLCLQNDKNVLCEKPLVEKCSELVELRECASKKHLFLSEGLWMLRLPTFTKANEWIDSGRIGKIQGIRVDLSKQEVYEKNASKHAVKDTGGVISDYGIYPIAFAMSFLQSQTTISLKHVLYKNGIDCDWTIVLTDGEVTSNITISSDFEGSKKAVIFGDKGNIVWNSQFNRTNTIYYVDPNGDTKDTFSIDYQSKGFEYEIMDVQNCIRSKKIESDMVPLNFSYRVLEMVNRLREK